jgi:hypothetical protein
MGLVIISDNPEDDKEEVKVDESCIVCMADRPEGFANDIEKIFWALNSLDKKELPEADSQMCEAHAKKAKGLKIHVSNDELFELDATSILKERPQARKITEEEYHYIPENEDETKV